MQPFRRLLPSSRLQTSKSRQSLCQSGQTRDLPLIHRLEPLILEQLPPDQGDDRRKRPTRLVRSEDAIEERYRFLCGEVGGLDCVGGEVECGHCEEFGHGECMTNDVDSEVGVFIQDLEERIGIRQGLLIAKSHHTQYVPIECGVRHEVYPPGRGDGGDEQPAGVA